MSKEFVELEIRGMTPRPYSTNGEGPWREYIANYVSGKLRHNEIPESHLRVDSSDRFEVSLVFHILPSANPPDLDNLSKPVLDALFFAPRPSKFRKGALYAFDDHQVWKLHLEKRIADTGANEGVSVRIDII